MRAEATRSDNHVVFPTIALVYLFDFVANCLHVEI